MISVWFWIEIGRSAELRDEPTAHHAANRRACATLMPQLTASSKSDDLAGIHDAIRIERAFDGTHGIERGFAVLGREIGHLALPHAMLAGRGAIHGKRALNEALAQRLRPRNLIAIGEVDEQCEMEIAVAHM